VARSSLCGFQRVVDNYAQEPRRERTTGIELLDPLAATQERIAHDVFGELTITHDEVRSAGGLELMTLHKHFQPTDVSTAESVDSLAFV